MRKSGGRHVVQIGERVAGHLVPGGAECGREDEDVEGGLYTDFDVTALPVAASPAENRNGKFVWSSRRMTGVRIGRGGPELEFETLNGNVMIKNREK